MRLAVPHRVLLGLRQLAAARRAAPRACSGAPQSRGATAAAAAASGGSTEPAASAPCQQQQLLPEQQAEQPPQPHAGQPTLILGIESSCDDTGVAVVSASGRVLGESLASQADIHAAWGGVVPKLAQEAHEAAIDGCVEAALAAAGVRPDQLDAVAVTIGPGLSLCLRVGVLKARQLAAAHRLPLIPVHHMEAHALVARLGATRFAADAAAAEQAQQAAQQQQQQAAAAAAGGSPAAGAAPEAVASVAAAAAEAAAAGGAVEFPFLCLLISGGHNLLLLVEGIGQYTQLGTTLDDALGEAYDKVARLLGLELKPSGGAALEAFAREGDPHALPFSVPMQRRPTCDFSYAGLKTAVRLAIEEQAPEPADANRQLRADIAASFQRVAVAHLEERCRRAVGWVKESHPQVRHLVVAGGVASNQYIRGRLSAIADAAGLRLVCPPPRLCTDNGVMVAWAGMERYQLGLVEPPPASAEVADGEWLDLRPRWPLTDRKDPRSFTAPRSAKKKRIFTSLTQLMHQQQQGETGAAAGEAGQAAAAAAAGEAVAAGGAAARGGLQEQQAAAASVAPQ